VSAAGPPALCLRGISRRFVHVQALDGAELTVRPRSVHAVLGENGAGKSTLMRIAFGLERADRGVVERDGRPVELRSPHDAIAAGIGMVHQHFSLVAELTVAENIALGGRGRLEREAAMQVVRRLADQTGLLVDPAARVADLPVSARQRAEILKAFARNASVIILDEPTAVLTPSEARELLARIRDFATAGTAVVLITHKLREALDAADEVTVLRAGRTVLTAPARGLTEHRLVEAMVGDRAPGTIRRARVHAGEPVIELADAQIGRSDGSALLERVRCVVRAGEIVGIAGAEGSGVRELVRVLAGRSLPSGGRVVQPPYVGFVPADRQGEALLLDGTLVENVALANAGSRRGRMPWQALRDSTCELLERFSISASGVNASARSLSGGNQQRLVVGRELQSGARALVVESPSRGLDILAAAALQRDLLAARDSGVAVVVQTGDLEELVALSDRVLVCHGGNVVEVPADLDAVVRAMVGAV
jgi:ABC-type uncharacterized transport system ATPase subunit